MVPGAHYAPDYAPLCQNYALCFLSPIYRGGFRISEGEVLT